jgi:hypothetical protein
MTTSGGLTFSGRRGSDQYPGTAFWQKEIA